MEIKSQKQAKKVLLQMQRKLYGMEQQYKGLHGLHKEAMEKAIAEAAALWLFVLDQSKHKGYISDDMTIDNIQLKSPEEIGEVTTATFNRVTELSQQEANKMNESLQETLAQTQGLIDQTIASFEHKGYKEAVEDSKQTIVDFQGEEVTPELYRAVARYLTAQMHYARKTDSTNLSTATSDSKVLNEAANLFYQELQNCSEETSVKFAKFASAVAENLDPEEKEGLTSKLWIGAKEGGAIVIDVALGVVKYVYNGVTRILCTAKDIASYTIGKVLSLIDAATTADFGKSGKHGVLLENAK